MRGQVGLNLASGSGLVAIAAASAGAASVIPSETDPLAVAAIALNAGVNRDRLEPTRGDLLGAPWPGPLGPGQPGPAPEAGAPLGADVVLAGDAFYDRDMATRLLPFLERASQAGALVLLGDPARAYLSRGRFTQVAAYDVPVERVVEDAGVKPSPCGACADHSRNRTSAHPPRRPHQSRPSHAPITLGWCWGGRGSWGG